MVLKSHYGTPLVSNAGFTLMSTPIPSSILMVVVAQPSSKSHVIALRMSITGGLSKTQKRKAL